MKTNRSARSGALPGVPDDEVTRLAERAISILLSKSEARRAAAEAHLLLLCDAFLAREDEGRRAIMARLQGDAAALDDIVDQVVPALARYMGLRWGNDEIGFADVTIGCARLQETVRILGRTSQGRDRVGAMRDMGRILMVIPRGETHTLGTFVAAQQFRRRGFLVDVALDQRPQQIADMVRRTGYDMIGISAAGRRTLASARELVKTMRVSVRQATPIVLSGSVVGDDSRMRAQTGVDHVVQDTETAIRVCRLGILREVRADASS